jgi:hypothetical protein
MRSVERRLERFVEGTVGRLFRGGVRPVEIGHRIAREMSDSRSVGVRGQPVVANHFTVRLAPDDLERFAEVHDSLVRELCDATRDHAREEGWAFMGPVQVELEADEGLRGGAIAVTARMKEADGAVGVLLLPTGQQVVLGEFTVTLGRLPECTISFDDPNISREHATIHPEGDGFVLTDKGSTNGTRVNGVAITSHRLCDGDRIELGATGLEFRAG